MEAQQSALQQSSEKWVEELSRAAEELNGAAKQIQADFAAASVRSVSNGYVRARFLQRGRRAVSSIVVLLAPTCALVAYDTRRPSCFAPVIFTVKIRFPIW